MFPSVDRRWLMAGIIAVLVLGAALPAYAMDKLWRFWKPEDMAVDYGSDYPRIRAFTNAMEDVTDQHDSWRTPWEVPTDGSNVDWVLKSGVYCTRLLYNELPATEGDLPTNSSTGEAWSWDKAAKIGWSTADGSCRLSDLTWVYKDGGTVQTQSVADIEDVGSEVPGGGYVIGLEPNYVWYITNDTTYLLKLINTEFTWVQQPPWQLDLDYLSTAADEGGTGVLIRALGDSVMDAGAKGDLKDPSVTSLLGKLKSASEDHLAGLAAAQAGDLAEAEADWAAAIKHMENFIKEIMTSMKTGKIREDLALLWVPIAQEIIGRFDLLPDVMPPPGFDPGTLVGLAPGESIALEFQAHAGDAVMIQGVLEDQDTGEVVLTWVDKVDIKADMIPPVVDLYINGEYVDPDTGLPLPWYRDDVTVTLASEDDDLASIRVVEHPYYDPNDPTEHPLPDPVSAFPEWSKTFSAEGVYVIAFWGVDTSGNTSEIQSITVRIDKTAPTVTGFYLDPDTMWPPDHGLYEVTFHGVVDEEDCHWEVRTVTSNQPLMGTGDGDTYPDWYPEYPETPIYPLPQWLQDELQFDENGNERLWLRSERSGNHPTEIREYTVTVVAVDHVGNASLPQVGTVQIVHDSGT